MEIDLATSRTVYSQNDTSSNLHKHFRCNVWVKIRIGILLEIYCVYIKLFRSDKERIYNLASLITGENVITTSTTTTFALVR